MIANGCYNRSDFLPTLQVQDGWKELNHAGATRLPVMTTIPYVNSKDCQYSIATVDARCDGCKHNQRRV